MCFSLLWGKKVLGGSECMSAEKKFSLIFLALQCNRWLRRQRTCLQQGDLDSTPRSGRCPGEWNGNSYQYSFLENPLDINSVIAETYFIHHLFYKDLFLAPSYKEVTIG